MLEWDFECSFCWYLLWDVFKYITCVIVCIVYLLWSSSVKCFEYHLLLFPHFRLNINKIELWSNTTKFLLLQCAPVQYLFTTIDFQIQPVTRCSCMHWNKSLYRHVYTSEKLVLGAHASDNCTFRRVSNNSCLTTPTFDIRISFKCNQSEWPNEVVM